MAEASATEKFFRYFRDETAALKTEIDEVVKQSLPDSERKDVVDRCMARIVQLSNEVRDASSYLPAHDQRTYGETVKRLLNRLQDVRSSTAPKSKFSFKAGSAKRAERSVRPSNTVVAPQTSHGLSNTSPAAGLADANPRLHDDTAQQSAGSGSAGTNLTNMDGCHVVLPVSASHATTSGMLSFINRCVLDMSAPTAIRPFDVLTLTNVSKSFVICGHANGAVHLTNVSNSTIVIASRQFRMHGSHDCDVYLLTSSRPIIEDCSKIQFAPLPDTYLMESDRTVVNQWENVDDFKWLRSEPSPNWGILEESQRVKANLWSSLASKNTEDGPDNVLRMVGIPP